MKRTLFRLPVCLCGLWRRKSRHEFKTQKGTLMCWEDSRPARHNVPEMITWNNVP